MDSSSTFKKDLSLFKVGTVFRCKRGKNWLVIFKYVNGKNNYAIVDNEGYIRACDHILESDTFLRCDEETVQWAKEILDSDAWESKKSLVSANETMLSGE